MRSRTGLKFCMLLLCFMIVGIFHVNAEAKTTLKLSRSKITMQVGKKATISVRTNAPTKRIKWSVSNKKVLSISASGKKVTVKAKKTGKARVICKIGKVKKQCIVTVKKAPNFAGSYKSKDRNQELTIKKLSNGRYRVDFVIIRLANIDNGRGILKNGKLYFTSKDPAGNPLKGVIQKTGRRLKLTLTKCTWTYLFTGDTFYFY